MMIVISIEFALLYYSRCLVGYVYSWKRTFAKFELFFFVLLLVEST